MGEKGIVGEIKMRDLRDAIIALNESGLLKGLEIKDVDEKHRSAEGALKLVGIEKEKILQNFMKAVAAIPDNDEGKFPGPKGTIDFYNTVVEMEEKAAKKTEKAAEKTEKATTPKKEKGEKKAAAPKKDKEPTVTKKSLVIEGVNKEGGSTQAEMAQACTDAKLGDYDTNFKTVGLWLKKLGFPVKKVEKDLGEGKKEVRWIKA